MLEWRGFYYSVKISLSPHIGASTVEAQEKIGLEFGRSTDLAFCPKKT
jgi:phosphoglycerate dehydrogenase-like enzyme